MIQNAGIVIEEDVRGMHLLVGGMTATVIGEGEVIGDTQIIDEGHPRILTKIVHRLGHPRVRVPVVPLPLPLPCKQSLVIMLNFSTDTIFFFSRRPSPKYEPPPDSGDENMGEDEDSEARSVFVSQLAARLTAKDLGYFFEDKLGEGTVKDARIVTDRLSKRSKG